jgi:hypothetical protein
MKRTLQITGLLLIGAAGSLQTACTTVHAEHPTTAATAGKAIMCDKCKTTWVTSAQPGARATRYTRDKMMVCPDCSSAVETWMKTGKLKHSCSHCKGKMSCEDPQ